MTGLAPKYVRLAAYFIREEMRRRQGRREPIPRALHELADALNSALSAGGHETFPTTPDPSRWKTTEQLAAESQCSARTVRRKAAAAGGRKIHDRWVFEEDA